MVIFTIPARKLLEILNALTDHENITFTVLESKVDITAGKSKISLPTLPASDFPFMDPINTDGMTPIENNDLSC